ncbi:MAG: TRAP transporter small permease [Deferrisomatales bacterium]|nr:TRAP transporter small permease [Deferrisomatales bacterium]
MLDRGIEHLTTLLKRFSAVTLAAMMLLTCVDVVGRAAGRPVTGAVEVTGLLATLTLAFSLPYTQRVRGHVGVDLLFQYVGSRTQAAIEALTGCLAMLLFGAIAWKSAEYAAQMRASGEVSMTLQLPTYLVIYLIAGSFAVLALVQGSGVLQSAAASLGLRGEHR